MPPLVLTIPGEMPGKGRHRVRIRGQHAQTYTPEKTVMAEAWVRQCCHDQLGAPLLDGPLAVSITVNKLVPRSWSQRKRYSALQGSIRPTSKPDASNVTKLIEDALNKVLWHDDSQIVDLTVRKFYAPEAYSVLTVEAL